MKRRTLVFCAAAVACVAGCAASQRHPSTAPASQTAATAGDSAKQAAFDAALVGRWTGDAQIVVQWADQKQLPIDLVIARDGTVSGTVGDARLVNARLVRSRGRVERSLGWGRDWRIHGQLTGDLIQAEQIHRQAVDIVFNNEAGTLVGGVNSSGSKVGGKDSMILAAGNMRLHQSSVTQLTE